MTNLRMHFCLIRAGITATSLTVSIVPMNRIRRVIWGIGVMGEPDATAYHAIGLTDIGDVSSTDFLEEVTGGMTGTTYDIMTVRTLTGSHLEMELEAISHG